MDLYKQMALTGTLGAICLVVTLTAGILFWPLIVHRLFALVTLIFIGLHGWLNWKMKHPKK